MKLLVYTRYSGYTYTCPYSWSVLSSLYNKKHAVVVPAQTSLVNVRRMLDLIQSNEYAHE